ncbi:hypothetical protein BC833DRAFT_533221, partial [Globomyces pollinis-pini]
MFDVSKYAIIRTIWTLVVYYFQRSDHILFGSVTNGRKTGIPNIENTIGMMINTIPVPVHLKSSTKISEIMKYLHDFHISSIPHLQT